MRDNKLVGEFNSVELYETLRSGFFICEQSSLFILFQFNLICLSIKRVSVFVSFFLNHRSRQGNGQ